jgi:hypothetical protein
MDTSAYLLDELVWRTISLTQFAPKYKLSPVLRCLFG